MNKLMIRLTFLGRTLKREATITIEIPEMVEGMAVYPTGEEGELVEIKGSSLAYYADNKTYYLATRVRLDDDEVLERAKLANLGGWGIGE